MLILTIRTDKPEAEIGLYTDGQQLAYYTWTAHRQLAETIHQKISALLAEHDFVLKDIEGIVCFQGPGSFTGLRIGVTVANAMAMGLTVPVVAAQEPEWAAHGVQKIIQGTNEYPIVPYYGMDAHITPPKK